MTKDQENVTPHEGREATMAKADSAATAEPLDFGTMMRSASPTLRRLVVYQGVILLVLLMVVVGGLAYKGSVRLLAPATPPTTPNNESAPAIRAGQVPEAVTDTGTDRGRDTGTDRGRDTIAAVILAIRPPGTRLIRAERQDGGLFLHFRGESGDYIRIVEEESGIVRAYDIP